MMKDKMSFIVSGIIICIVLLCGYFYCEKKYDEGYDSGYKDGYRKGYSDGYSDKGKLTENSSAKVETVIQYEKIPYNGSDVQITTKPPTVSVSVNGKKQEVVQTQETADVQVQTNAEVKLKLPTVGRWQIGIGTDGHKPAYMLKTPAPFVKNQNVGLWIAGVGRDKIMGGVSVSF